MWITKPGPVTDDILLLGKEESCVYLIKGEEHTIIGGGMTYIVPDILNQFKKFVIDEKKITRLLILHSHFDHIGIAPFLKRRLPQMKVVGSARARELLSTPKVMDYNKDMNMALVAARGVEGKAKELGITIDDLVIDEVVKGGERVVWGGVELEIIDAPGHSSCSIAAYMPKARALFASDAGGIPFGEEIFASGNSDYDKYEESLRKFAGYDVDIHLAEHYGAFTEEEGRGFMARSIASAEETRRILEESYRRTKDIDKSSAEIAGELMKGAAEGYFLPKELMELVIRQMLKHIAKKVEID